MGAGSTPLMEREPAKGDGTPRGSSAPPLLAPARWPAGRLRLRRLDGLQVSSFAEDVRDGLTSSPKFLQPKYFYDELGSLLFEVICALPEYYLTRAEAEILHARAGEIAASLPGPVQLVELGSGDARKTRLLIDALLARQGGLDYLPVDISHSALEASSQDLLGTYPNLRVTAYLADYLQGLRAIQEERPARSRARHTLVLFLGSTIGNLDPAERESLLRDVRGVLQPGDGLLLGADLKKDESILLPAYDDPLGVTASFNKNLLARINREFGGDLDLRAFQHRAVYDAARGRVEMHLESTREQTVAIRSLGLTVRFAAGETIHTESSHKFDTEQIAALARDTGFDVARTWHDGARRFASFLLTAG